MYAITPFGVGRSVGARAIKPGWPLADGEVFTVADWHDGLVLAEGGVSLRQRQPDDPPDGPPREVSKLAIVDRLEAAGLRAAAKTALAQDDLRQDRWDNAVAVRADDADVRTLLTAIGADPDVILAPA